MKEEEKENLKQKINLIKLDQIKQFKTIDNKMLQIKSIVNQHKKQIENIRKISEFRLKQNQTEISERQTNMKLPVKKAISVIKEPFPSISTKQTQKKTTSSINKYHKNCIPSCQTESSVEPYSDKKMFINYKPKIIKQVPVNQFDRLTYQKKYKQFLKQKNYTEIQGSAPPKLKIKQNISQNDPALLQLLQQTTYKQLLQRYNEIYQNAQKWRKPSILKYNHKYLYDFRKKEFEKMQQDNLVSKKMVRQYLFDKWYLMMLFNIDPMNLDFELADYDSKIPGKMDFIEFSKFLLLYRPIVNVDNYQPELLYEAKEEGPKLLIGPAKCQFIGRQQVYDFFKNCFKQVDLFGFGKVQRGILAIKLKIQMQKLKFQDEPVIEVINIKKIIPVHRLVYQIEFQEQREQWQWEEYQYYLLNYKRLKTPEKDKLMIKLIMTGKQNPTYITICSQLVILIVKQVFNDMQKIAEYFVSTQKFVKRLIQHPKFEKIAKEKVRKEKIMGLEIENVEEVVWRIMEQADDYLDIQDILDFFTNRGRPREYQVHAQEQKSSKLIEEREEQQDQDQVYLKLKEKKINRFIQNMKKQNIQLKGYQNKVSKRKNITVPVPFSFEQREQDINLIQKKLDRNLTLIKQAEEFIQYKPFKANPVPESSKTNMYQLLKKQQQILRKNRIEKFKAESKKFKPPSAHLLQKKQPKIHCQIYHDNYQFAARPIPWYCQVELLDRLYDYKQKRKLQIHQEIMEKHQSYGQGSNIKNMNERLEVLKKKWKIQQNRRQRQRSVPEQPRHISKSVPNFKFIHQKLLSKLQSRQKMFVPTKPIDFVFLTSQSKRQKKIIAMQRRSYSPKKRMYFKSVQERPSSTLKFDAMVEFRKKEKILKQQKQKEEQYQDKIRQMRKKKFAPYVRRALPKVKQFVLEQKMAKLYQQQKAKQAQFSQQMQQMYTRVLQRPLLAQQYY